MSIDPWRATLAKEKRFSCEFIASRKNCQQNTTAQGLGHPPCRVTRIKSVDAVRGSLKNGGDIGDPQKVVGLVVGNERHQKVEKLHEFAPV